MLGVLHHLHADAHGGAGHLLRLLRVLLRGPAAGAASHGPKHAAHETETTATTTISAVRLLGGGGGSALLRPACCRAERISICEMF